MRPKFLTKKEIKTLSNTSLIDYKHELEKHYKKLYCEISSLVNSYTNVKNDLNDRLEAIKLSVDLLSMNRLSKDIQEDLDLGEIH